MNNVIRPIITPQRSCRGAMLSGTGAAEADPARRVRP